ncbi:hypothetical protein O181_077963 [Austropuccinia psidii MF-1]|uniref:Uncharacterized protein n=1 Tax=Austropuccinia psidii MF-1 TaxID=1389203 RepID=A0A9Q3FDT4_9BASI|nr:hypothetical protein [Austropuccinia psidii MF-1]
MPRSERERERVGLQTDLVRKSSSMSAVVDITVCCVDAALVIFMDRDRLRCVEDMTFGTPLSKPQKLRGQVAKRLVLCFSGGQGDRRLFSCLPSGNAAIKDHQVTSGGLASRLTVTPVRITVCNQSS